MKNERQRRKMNKIEYVTSEQQRKLSIKLSFIDIPLLRFSADIKKLRIIPKLQNVQFNSSWYDDGGET